MNQPNLILVAFLLFVPLMFLFFTRSFGACPIPATGFGWCTVYDFVRDFKEVFGWLVAMYVAYIAAQPVWRQLELMRDDVAISSIKYLEQEVEALKKLRAGVDVELGALIGYVQAFCRIDDEFGWSGDANAAHTAAGLASTAHARIAEMNIPYGDEVDGTFSSLISAVSDLGNCFHEMNLAVYLDGDPEVYIDDETVADIESAAARAIDDRISGLHRAKSSFDAGVATAIIHRIDLISRKKGAMFASR